MFYVLFEQPQVEASEILISVSNWEGEENIDKQEFPALIPGLRQ